jgi:hypothetical protein
MKASEFGINGGWGGLRTTSAFVDKFDANTTDTRGNFIKMGKLRRSKTLELYRWICYSKFRNVDVNGKQGSDKTGDFSDADFPIFRLADAYLMYAECAVRGAGGSLATATTYVNALRTRANGPSVTQGILI